MLEGDTGFEPETESAPEAAPAAEETRPMCERCGRWLVDGVCPVTHSE